MRDRRRGPVSGPSSAVVPVDDEVEATLTLVAAPGIGPGAAARLRARFGSHLGIVKAAFCGARSDLPGRMAEAIRVAALDGAGRRELAAVRASGARYVVWGSPGYPEPLSAMARPPVGVCVAGRPLGDLQPAIAVVGTRAATRRGLTIARDMSFDLASAGLTVVSGLARGIDTAAHEGALEGGGTTVAVLGAGLGHIYPRENTGLARRIRASGALVSEYPVDQRPRAGSFPARNRIIAGLSAGVLVIEAGARSGALITAARALEEGREVFAVPGPITEPLSAGPNGLIKAGAKLVEGVSDILDELEWLSGEAAHREPAPEPDARGETSGAASSLLRHLAIEPRTIDDLTELSGLAPSVVATLLLELELAGRACACEGGTYAAAGRRGQRSGDR